VKYKIITRSGIIKYRGNALSKIDAQLFEAPLLTEDELIQFAHDADAVITGPFEPYTRRVIGALAKCRLISRAGIGYNNIDVASATDYGIPVSYIPDAMIKEVSDHTIALILCFSRKIMTINDAVKNGAWQRGEIMNLIKPLHSLSQQTLGLFGLGRIGAAVCGKAKALDMKVIVYDPYLAPAAIKQLGAEPVEFSKLLTESDYLSQHTPLTKETKHAFGLEQFRKMKPTAIIINTARGPLIKEDELIEALSKEYIGGAGLDVTDPEPPALDSRLMKLENVILTAHTAFYSERSMAELTERAVDAVVSALTGEWPVNLANPEVRKSPICRLGKR
jgi:D-3-phosphoglycerate dehydrogenase / 2-oxoglutarate reductase